jgi:hypothetical protein
MKISLRSDAWNGGTSGSAFSDENFSFDSQSSQQRRVRAKFRLSEAVSRKGQLKKAIYVVGSLI